MPNARDHLPLAAGLALCLAAAIAAFPLEQVAKTALVGPIYPMEGLFLVWAACAGFSWLSQGRPWPGHRIPAWVAGLLAFFGWGLALLAVDFTLHRSAIQDRRTALRAFQHASLFITPVLWVPAGYWLARHEKRLIAPLLWTVAVLNCLPLFWSYITSNLSIGALSAIGAVLAIERARRSPKGRAIAWAAAAAAALVLTYAAFWLSWLYHSPFQRTSLTLVVLMIIGTALLRRRAASPWPTLAIALGVFVAGFAALSALRPVILAQPATVASQGIASDFYRSFEKEDDHPSGGGEEQHFQFSIRRMWWKESLDLWRESPWTGIGLIPELPPRVRPGMPNDWASAAYFYRLGGHPVSGPHNSYLGILVRLGVIGLALFGLLAATIGRPVLAAARRDELTATELVVLFGVVNGAFHAALNVGLESPRNSMFLWLCSGLIVAGVGRGLGLGDRPGVNGRGAGEQP